LGRLIPGIELREQILCRPFRQQGGMVAVVVVDDALAQIPEESSGGWLSRVGKKLAPSWGLVVNLLAERINGLSIWSMCYRDHPDYWLGNSGRAEFYGDLTWASRQLTGWRQDFDDRRLDEAEYHFKVANRLWAAERRRVAERRSPAYKRLRVRLQQIYETPIVWEDGSKGFVGRTDELYDAHDALVNLDYERAECLAAEAERRAKLKVERAKLDKLNAEAAALAGEIESLDGAIAQAARHVQQAQAAETQVHASEVARELMRRANTLAQLAESLDSANVVRIEASNAMAEELRQIRELARGLGVFVPSDAQFSALASRADITAAMQLPFAREVVAEHLQPSQRRTHMSYAASWRDAISQGAAAILRDEKDEAAA
jgi:hypothetical protein